MSLIKHLKGTGVVTGPISRNTSHSALDVIKRYLCGIPQFTGGEAFFGFGRALHELLFENKIGESFLKLSSLEKIKIKNMVLKLKTHAVVSALLKDSVNEKKLYSIINGVELSYILDCTQPKLKRGGDLKTTSCRSKEDFINKAKEYGYFRQGLTYITCHKLKHFYFFAIDKNPPHNIFILDISLYPEELAYAKGELDFLLYFYKNYGTITPEYLTA